MRRKVAFPFLTIPDELVTLGEWLIGDPGCPLNPADEILENWDYARNLEVSLDVAVDFQAVAEALQLDSSELMLGVVLKAGSGVGRFSRRTLKLSSGVLDLHLQKVTLCGVLPADQLSGRLRLDCEILLIACGSSSTRLSPSSKGARLWSDSFDLLLEGGGHSRFPVESVSFERAFSIERVVRAPWFVFWKDCAWDMDFGSAVRLYVNSDMEDIQARVVEGDPLTLQAILADAVSQIVRAYVADDDACERASLYADGTLGAQAKEWLEMLFPGKTLEFVRSELEHMPGEFQATVLAAMEIGRGG